MLGVTGIFPVHSFKAVHQTASLADIEVIDLTADQADGKAVVGGAFPQILLSQDLILVSPDVLQLVPVPVQQRNSLLKPDAYVILALIEGVISAVGEVALLIDHPE